MHPIRLLLFLVALPFLTLSLSAQKYESFSANGKYGIKNTLTGNTVVDAQFESVGWSKGSIALSDGFTGAQQNEKWALYKLDGTKLTDHLYAELYPFIDGLFIVAKRSSGSILLSYGIINSKGKTVLPHGYTNLEPYDGTIIVTKQLASVYRKGVLSPNGKTLIPIEFSTVKGVEKGLFEVKNNKGRAALYDNNGKALTAFDFESIKSLNDQFLEVVSYGRLGLIDKKGNTIVEPIYKSITSVNGKTRALPFTKWDYYSSGSFQRSLFFDQIDFVRNDAFAVNSAGNMGLLNSTGEFINYKPGFNFKRTSNGLSIVKEIRTGFSGVIDATGKQIVPLNYDSLVITDDLVFVQTRNENSQYWNVLSRKGKKQSLYEYDRISKMQNGVIEASRNRKYGFLDPKTGKESSPFFYDSISPFKNGLAVVGYQNSFGAINAKGNWVITPYSDSLSILGNRVLSKQGSEYKVFSLEGKLLTNSYYQLVPLPLGYYQNEADGLVLYNDLNKRLLEPNYDVITAVSSDLYLLTRDSLRFLYRPSDKSDYRLDDGIQFLGQYYSGYFPVKIDDQWGYLNSEGQLKIANRYEAVGTFSEGLFSVKVIGKWAFLDENENFVIQPIYEEVDQFTNGLCVVKGPNGYGMIDRSGKEILALKYAKIERKDGFILLMKNELLGIADVQGKLTKDPQFDNITALKEGFFLVERAGLKGIININGEDVVPIVYENIIQNGDQFLASESATWHVIDLK
ncbi:WG repeat-containing protein [Roseivirga misakiensis]|uniref:WG repeat-containing protein n=1 Tax=Roseivirga misakiensis TaxID=1563681 RepID=A0A1E5T241_9BACT|nr:WG repeat-containing protein [Roseivirga misakiensis]OEK05445.1 hypothetical protein BFP71_18855 [Roseivirga misakiensis]